MMLLRYSLHGKAAVPDGRLGRGVGVRRPVPDTLMTEDAPRRRHDLREVFNAMRYVVRAGEAWRMMPNDLPPWPAVYPQSQR